MTYINISKQKTLSGFTLIELLVVIAIIAIITSIGVANLITAQKQARDSARKEIIGNVQTAFEQYFVEFGEYPSLDTGSAFEGGITPNDPKEDSNPLSWEVSDTSYCVCATLENGTGNATEPLGSSCAWSDTGTYYCAQNKQ